MKIHIVRSGDTLWDLVQKYNIPFERLLEANPGIQDKEELEIGTKVKIPTGKIPVSPSKHPVQEPVQEPVKEEVDSNTGEPESVEEGWTPPDYSSDDWEDSLLFADQWDYYDESSSSAASLFAPYHPTENAFTPTYLPPLGAEKLSFDPPPYPPPFLYPFPYQGYDPMQPVKVDEDMKNKESSSVEYS